MPETAVIAIMIEIVIKAGRVPILQGMVAILQSPVSQSGNKETRIAKTIRLAKTTIIFFLEARRSAIPPTAMAKIPSALSA